ncbi:MAG: cytochrome c-type biogenesis protein [Nitrincola lacisaponensis]|uniref:Cytochrome c-type biogenesis protein n=1 Tax=Nitrincola lacisaponensis TaxID=267850 RepID=A0A063Y635_9GAMM|nr:cytochrome c-type biogenesis protein [Nitrincola lacisaponensis]KDE40600.1 Cytochrome c heme lyase subunit CcmL [Nitrincola lacisaponensis]
MKLTLLPLLLCLLSFPLWASFETYEFSTTHNEMRYFHLSKELRCPTCQNQNISDSDAPLAADLRRELHRMIESGYDDDAILDFMVSRFGDFVHYRPRVAPETYLLWYGPFVLLFVGFGAVLMVARNRRLRAAAVQDAQVTDTAEESAGVTPLTPQERERLENLLRQDKNL